MHLATFEGAPRQYPWTHAPPSQRPDLGSPFHLPHSLWLRSVGLLGANHNLSSSPEGPFPRGLARQCWGLGTDKPQCQSHPVAKPPHGRIRALPLIQDGSKGRALRAPGNIRRPPVPKPLGPLSPSTCPHFGQPQHTPHSPGLLSMGLLGSNPNPRLAPEGPIPRALAPQRWDLGNAKPQCQTHPVPRLPHGPISAPQLIQDGRKCRALRAPGHI